MVLTDKMLLLSALVKYFNMRNNLNFSIRVVHLDVEVSSEELLAPAILCHKEPARRIQSPLLGLALERKIGTQKVLYGTRAPIMGLKLSTNERAVM